MTLRNRLTSLFTAIVSGLLLLFCGIIYLVAERHRQDEFRERLEAEAITSAELLFGPDTTGRQLYKLLDKNHMTVLDEEEIIIYDYRNRIVYESGTDYLTVSKSQLNQVRLAGHLYWRVGLREIIGIRYTQHNNRLVVLASGVDKYGFSKQRALALLLSIGWGLAVLIVFGSGLVYAGRALRPIRRIIRQIDTITASKLERRLAESTDADELTQLAQRFNRMLDRLEEAFRQQRTFVSHASHELRTPLTAITGQLEVALLAGDDLDELRATVRSVLEDVRDLNRLTNGLLSLANVSVDESAVAVGTVSLDELVWQVRADLLRLRPDYTVAVTFGELPNQQTALLVTGSESLLRTALFNLMENGGKFSPDHRVSVRLTVESDTIALIFHNQGPPIPAEELPEIFKPFQRGTNGRTVAGHGIGLSLTQRIVQLHRGRLTVTSNAVQGTFFRLDLPRSA
ncbi:HAMP domain-containing sensor histidine kinase [Spirosoma sp.]|uniref:HAMP domain-containing sensor histidine kinase n=1 Tax=Spirosoma sp. TaxID=1899569 RepID=UPI002602BA3B|nr:HAMP domain-containing sensor histidine kinase [Spirosoma sp.]MCX6217761.1 HAMP domain-containing sensor histidine kinase [Spirosoma sp.]